MSMWSSNEAYLQGNKFLKMLLFENGEVGSGVEEFGEVKSNQKEGMVLRCSKWLNHEVILHQ